jgi:hypothetical protein
MKFFKSIKKIIRYKIAAYMLEPVDQALMCKCCHANDWLDPGLHTDKCIIGKLFGKHFGFELEED